MGQALGSLVPLGIAAAVSTVPILVTILILLSDNRNRSALPYLIGWVVGTLFLVTVGTMAASSLPQPRPRQPDTILGVLEILIGVAFVGTRHPHHPPSPGEPGRSGTEVGPCGRHDRGGKVPQPGPRAEPASEGPPSLRRSQPGPVRRAQRCRGHSHPRPRLHRHRDLDRRPPDRRHPALPAEDGTPPHRRPQLARPQRPPGDRHDHGDGRSAHRRLRHHPSLTSVATDRRAFARHFGTRARRHDRRCRQVAGVPRTLRESGAQWRIIRGAHAESWRAGRGTPARPRPCRPGGSLVRQRPPQRPRPDPPLASRLRGPLRTGPTARQPRVRQWPDADHRRRPDPDREAGARRSGWNRDRRRLGCVC